MSTKKKTEEQFDTLTLEREKLDFPKNYLVWIHNDDITTQEFVVEVLQKFFNKSKASAFKLMLTVHNDGKAVAGIFTKDIAETKVALVTRFSRSNSMPLNLTTSSEQ
ncbi:MAG: ATP-dependent Clp protease adaptor ClpS [bacterium]|nr:ATP-dependent Clp protease adaptor ClpS [bacterium]